jgi:hypothetical protein
MSRGSIVCGILGESGEFVVFCFFRGGGTVEGDTVLGHSYWFFRLFDLTTTLLLIDIFYYYSLNIKAIHKPTFVVDWHVRGD